MAVDSILQFYPLTFIPEGDEVIIGRSDKDSFAAFPADGAALLQKLQAGLSPEEASRWYQQQYQEPIDIADFLQTLQEMQFIRAADSSETTTVSMSDRLWQIAGKAAFSPPAWVLYLCLFGYCILLLIQHSYLLPNYRQLFFSPYYTLVELGIFLGQFPPILFHELFHMLAGRRQGLASRLGIGRRLYFIVFETHLTGLWSLPPRRRYLPFLAGMLADVLFFCTMTIIAAFCYNPTHQYAFPGAFCLAMAFATLLRFIWQFYFYLETDIYYVLTTALHCINLQQTTRRYIANRFFRLLHRPGKIEDETLWSPRDRQIAPWYAPIFLLGYAISLATFLFTLLPVAYQFLVGTFTHLFTATTANANFWDSGIFLALNTLQLVVLAIVFRRERRQVAKLASQPNPIRS